MNAPTNSKVLEVAITSPALVGMDERLDIQTASPCHRPRRARAEREENGHWAKDHGMRQPRPRQRCTNPVDVAHLCKGPSAGAAVCAAKSQRAEAFGPWR